MRDGVFDEIDIDEDVIVAGMRLGKEISSVKPQAESAG